MIKRICSAVLLAAMVIAVNVMPSFASESTDHNRVVITVNDDGGISANLPEGARLIGLDTVDPAAPQTRGTSKPKDSWDCSTSGEYSFSGTSYSQALYTEYLLTGLDSYDLYIDNNGRDLTYDFRKTTKSYSSSTIKAGKYLDTTVTGMNSTDKLYIKFTGQYQDFEGTVG